MGRLQGGGRHANGLPDIATEWDAERRRHSRQLFPRDQRARPRRAARERIRRNPVPRRLGLVRVGELGLDLERNPRLPGEVQQRRLVRPAAVLPGATLTARSTPGVGRLGTTAPATGSRTIITVNSNGRWPCHSAGIITRPPTPALAGAIQLGKLGASARTAAAARLNWLRGGSTTCDGERPQPGTPQFRDRPQSSPTQAGRHRVVVAGVRRQAAVPVPGPLESAAVLRVRRRQRHDRDAAHGVRGRQRRHAARLRRRDRRGAPGVHPGRRVPESARADPAHLHAPLSTSTARRRWATRSSPAPGTRCWWAASTRAAAASTRSTSPIRKLQRGECRRHLPVGVHGCRRSRLHLQPPGDRAHGQRPVGRGLRQRLQQRVHGKVGHGRICTSSTSRTAASIRKIDTGVGTPAAQRPGDAGARRPQRRFHRRLRLRRRPARQHVEVRPHEHRPGDWDVAYKSRRRESPLFTAARRRRQSRSRSRPGRKSAAARRARA